MSIYDFTVKDAKGETVSLSEFKGKVLLIVNTATHCGFTPQYEYLQDLYDRYQDKGLEILDFPCNQFANQAPGTQEEIASFCITRYGITFRQFEKILVNGKQAHPLYVYLKSKKGGLFGGRIRWNFTKFLVDREGNVTNRFSPTAKEEEIETALKRLL